MTDHAFGTGGATDPRPIEFPASPPSSRYPVVQFRAGDLLPALTARRQQGEAIGATARRDLERYYQFLDREIVGVGLTSREQDVIRDAMRGTVLDELTASVLTDEIADALMHDGLGAKWGIDDARLLGKLADLTNGQRLALVDLIERPRLDMVR